MTHKSLVPSVGILYPPLISVSSLKTRLLKNTMYPIFTMKQAVEPTKNGLDYIINIPDYYYK